MGIALTRSGSAPHVDPPEISERLVSIRWTLALAISSSVSASRSAFCLSSIRS
jgi:hypothetical protein